MADDTTLLRIRLLTRVQPTGKEKILPLFLDGHRIGTLTAKNLDFLSRRTMGQYFVVRGQTVTLSVVGDSYSGCFTRIAEHLREILLQRYWRDELLDIVPYGETRPIAKAERALFRFLGMTTRSVYAIAKDTDNLWILAQRSARKPIDPGLWDALAAGLVSSGESPFEALERETFEEAGLRPGQYAVPARPAHQLVVEREVPEGWLREEALFFPMRIHAGITPHNQDGEVEQFLRCDTPQLLTMIRESRLTLGASLGLLALNSGETVVARS